MEKIKSMIPVVHLGKTAAAIDYQHIMLIPLGIEVR